VIGGQAVNAFVEPLVSLDLDLVVAVDQIAGTEAMLRERFKVERFPHSLNIETAAPTSACRSRPTRATWVYRPRRSREVLGVTLP